MTAAPATSPAPAVASPTATRQPVAWLGAGFAMFLVGSMTGVGPLIIDYPVYGGQAVRYLVATVLMFGLIRLRRLPWIRLSTRDVLLILALAAVGLVAFNLFQLAALRHATPAVVGTILGSVPIVLAVAGPLATGRRPQVGRPRTRSRPGTAATTASSGETEHGRPRNRPEARTIAAAVVVAAGAAIATGFGSTDAAGVGYSLAMLACEAGFSLLAVPLLTKLGPLRTSAYAIAVSVPMLTVVGLLTDGAGFLRRPTGTELAGFAYIAVVVTVVAFLCWYAALPRLGADRAGLFAGFVPVGSILTAMVAGTGVPTGADLIGALVVIAGVLIGVWSRSKRGTGRVARTP
jgi:drug/metabolite transporter (DMT)-like permease